jgi:uncharacterized protein (DUF736 family)
MSYQKFKHQENKGSLFPNQSKLSDNHPDYKGSIYVGGKSYWISSWNATSKTGKTYMSLSVNEMEDTYSTKSNVLQNQKSNTAVDDEFDDEIPF